MEHENITRMFRASSLEAAKPEHIPFQFPTCDPLRHRFHAPSNPPVSETHLSVRSRLRLGVRCLQGARELGSSWICGNSRPPPGRHSAGFSGKGLAQNPASQPLTLGSTSQRAADQLRLSRISQKPGSTAGHRLGALSTCLPSPNFTGPVYSPPIHHQKHARHLHSGV